MSRSHRWSPVCPPPRGLVRPVPVDLSGRRGPTANQARGPRWRRTSPGLYVPADNSDDVPEQRILEQASRLGRPPVVTGWAALRLAGATFFDGLGEDGRSRLPVELVTGPGRRLRPTDGVQWRQDQLDEREVWVRYGIRCARPERALFDAMRTGASARAACVDMDMAAAAELTSIRRMSAYVDQRRRVNGVPVVRAGLALADENSRSPSESRLRLFWIMDADLPAPLANRDVFSPRGRLLGVADLIDVRAGVVGEYDGADHAAARRRSRDADRDSAFRDHGLEVFRVTGFDIHQPEALAARMRAAYARAGRPGRLCDWTLTPPPEWPDALTLDELLDQRDLLRELHTG